MNYSLAFTICATLIVLCGIGLIFLMMALHGYHDGHSNGDDEDENS